MAAADHPHEIKDVCPCAWYGKVPRIQHVGAISGYLRRSVDRKRPLMTIVGVAFITRADALVCLCPQERLRQTRLERHEAATPGGGTYERMVDHEEIIHCGQLLDRLISKRLQRAHRPGDMDIRVRTFVHSRRRAHRRYTPRMVPGNTSKLCHLPPLLSSTDVL